MKNPDLIFINVMKTVFLNLFMATAFFASATIITVDNNVNSPADYADLQAAHDAVAEGDTIYVAGSQTTYGILYVTKKLVLIGNGFNPENGMRTELLSINFEIDTSIIRV